MVSTYAYAKDRCIDVGRASFQCTESVRSSAESVVMKMSLDVAANHTSQSPDEIVDLARRCAAYGVSNTNAVDADFVDSGIDGEEIDEV